MSRAQILAIEVDKVTMDQAVGLCLSWVGGIEPRLVITPNAEIAHRAGAERELAGVINSADLVIADGIGVVWASRILGDPVPEKVAGIELVNRLLKALSDQRRGRVYLLGAKPEVVAESARRVVELYPGLTLAGYHHGYFGPDEEGAVVARVAEARPDVLVVGMGAPRQEHFMARYRHQLGAKVILGVGGTIDVWAGVSPRAPEWMLRANLEWLYRIVKLGRVSRSLPPLLKFGLAVAARRLRGG